MPPVADIRLADFDPDEHLPLLDRWLHEPHVRRWWGDPVRNLAEVQQRPPDGGHALITADGLPVGYICWQRYRGEDLAIIGLPDLPQAAIDLDIMIGETSYVGHGVGPQALGLLFARLGRDPSVPLVGLATSVDNVSAVRAYEKAGFTRVRQFNDPEFGPCWFMIADLRGSGRPTTRCSPGHLRRTAGAVRTPGPSADPAGVRRVG